MNIKKRILTIILLLCVFFPCISLASGCKDKNTPAVIAFSGGGNGTKDSPYLLMNNADFDTFDSIIFESSRNSEYKASINGAEAVDAGYILSAYYKLGADIDMGGVLMTAIGYGSDDITKGEGGVGKEDYTPFSGTFDGGNHQLRDLIITSGLYHDYWTHSYDGYFTTSTQHITAKYNGLFACVKNATIKNLWLDNCYSVLQVYETCNVYGGVLIGEAKGNTTITNCKITNSGIGCTDVRNGVEELFGGNCILNLSTTCGSAENLAVSNIELNTINVVQFNGKVSATTFDIENPNYNADKILVKAFEPAVGDSTVQNCVGQNLKFKYNYSDNTGSGIKWDSSSWGSAEISKFVGNVTNYQVKPNLPNGTFSYKTTLTEDYTTYPWYKPSYVEGSESNFNNGFLTLQQFMDSKTVTFATLVDESNNIVVDYEFRLPDGSKYDVSHSESDKVNVPVYKITLPVVGLPATLNKVNNYTSALENYQIEVKPTGEFLQNTIGCSLKLDIDDGVSGVYIYKPDFDIVKTEITFKQLNTDIDMKEYSASAELQDSKYTSYSVEDFVVDEESKKIYLGENIDLTAFITNNEEYSTGYEIEKYNGNNISAGSKGSQLIANVYKLIFNPKTGKLNSEFDSDVKYTIPAGMILDRTYKTVNITSEKLDIVIAPKLIEDDSDPNPDGTIDVSVEVYINEKTAPHTRFNSSSFKSSIAIGDRFVLQSSELINFFRISSPEDDAELSAENSSYVTGTLGNVNGFITILRSFKNYNETEDLSSLTDNKLVEVIKTKTVIKIYVTTDFNNCKIKVRATEVNGEAIKPVIKNGNADITTVDNELVISASSISIEDALTVTNNSVSFTINGIFTTSPYNGYDSITVKYTQGEMYQLSIDHTPISIDSNNVVVDPTFEVKDCIIDYRPARQFNTMEVSNIDPENVLLPAGGTITFENVGNNYLYLYSSNSGMKIKGYSIQPVDSLGNVIEYTNQYVMNGAKYDENGLLTEFTSITGIISNIAITPVYEDVYHTLFVNFMNKNSSGERYEDTWELRVKHGGSFNPVAQNSNTAVSLTTKTAEGKVLDVKNIYAHENSIYSHYVILTENAPCTPVNQNADGKYTKGLNSITGDVTIKLIFSIKSHTVTFVGVEGSDQEEREIDVVQGTEIAVEESSDASYVKFTVNGETITYKASTGYKYRAYSAIGKCEISNDGSEIVVKSDLQIRPLFIADAGLVIVELKTGIDDENDPSYQKLTVLDGTKISFGYKKTGSTETDTKEEFIVNITENAPMTYTTKNGQVGSGENAGNERWIFEKAEVVVGSTKYYFAVKNEKLYYGTSESAINTEVTGENPLITINTTDNSKTIVDYVRVQVYFERVYDITFMKEAIIEEGTGTYQTIKDVVSVNSNHADLTDKGSSFNMKKETADFGVNLTRSYEYIPGSTSELDIKISLIGSSLIKYTVARYYTIVGLKVDIDEDASQTNISITDKFDFNRGRNFTITPIVKFNAVKLNLGYDITNAKILYKTKNGRVTSNPYTTTEDKYVKDTYEWNNSSFNSNLIQVNDGTETGSKEIYYQILDSAKYANFCKGDIFLEYDSTITYQIGEIEVKDSQDVTKLANKKYNLYKITVREEGTGKMIQITFISTMSLQQLNVSSMTQNGSDTFEMIYNKDTYEIVQNPEVNFTFGPITSG